MEIPKITSAQNAIIKKFSNFNRRKTPNLICLDGVHLHEEYMRAEHPSFEVTLISEKFWNHTESQPFRELGNIHLIPESLMKKVSPTKSPVGILSIAPCPQLKPMHNQGLTLVLEAIQDPGNVGTILRSSLALGVNQIISIGSTADIWSSKCLRAGMGAQFNLPTSSFKSINDWAQTFCGPILATSLEGKNLWDEALPSTMALILGNEGQGISAEAASCSTHHIKIPMSPQSESLNVTAAQAIVCHEWAKQNKVF